MKNILVLLSLIFTSILCISQDFTRNRFIPVYRDGVALKSAWAGGINSGQVSRIDLNQDGFKDLFVFDRIGNRIMTFINMDASPGTINYEHRYEYVSDFPDDMVNWALLRDFNCDGKNDIFTSKTSGMKLYKNISDGGSLSFELEAEPIMASYDLSGNPFSAPLYSLTIDLPSIVDYEGDGDLDVISWTENATTLYYFHNNAVENGSCDSLDFVLGNRCYGQFAESSESFDLQLYDEFQCDFNAIDPVHSPDLRENNRDGAHAGGAIFQIDMDDNGVKDLMLSDIVDDYIKTLLLEVDTEGLDSTFSATDFFPAGYTDDQTILYSDFPAGFYEDIDNDGVSDLLSSPNGIFSCRDDNSMWLYKNVNEETNPYFEFVEENFLQKDMIDMGRGAYPIPVDYNGDGLMDLIVANNENYIENDIQPCRMMIMKNIGSLDSPEFSIVNDNYLDLNGQGFVRAYPAFGDLDNDGDIDLVIGRQDGTFAYYENQASLGNEPDFVQTIEFIQDNAGGNLDVGKVATPQLFDLDEDGLLDIVAGEENGNINFVKNLGSLESFNFEHQIDTIGGVVASNLLGTQGNSVPFLFRNDEDNIELIVGTEIGIINHYDDIEGNLDGEFNLITDQLGDIKEGTYSGACLVDFTNDGLRDLIYGQVGGGLAFYQGGDSLTIGIHQETETFQTHIFPNPASDVVSITMDPIFSNGELTIFNSLGQLVHSEVLNENKVELSSRLWDTGIYVIKLQAGPHSTSKNLMILRN